MRNESDTGWRALEVFLGDSASTEPDRFSVIDASPGPLDGEP